MRRKLAQVELLGFGRVAKQDSRVKNIRLTESPLVAIFKEFKSGTPANDLAAKRGIHDNTTPRDVIIAMPFQTSDLVQLKELDVENMQMRRIRMSR